MKLIEITWIDSGAQEGRVWDFKEEYTWPRDEFKTIGYKLAKKDGYLYVAQSLSQYQYGRVFRIPLSCIIKIRRLKRAS
jgi:hypothetical protein